jgi:tetratricopeptide (TPR) repeat protein
MFPDEPETKQVMIRRQEILNNMNIVPVNAANTAATQAANERIIQSQQYINQGAAAFGTGVPEKDDLKKAAQLFLKAAELNPGNYTTYENAAMCYFNMHDYPNAIRYFSKVLDMHVAKDGKSEFFKAVALMNSGKNEEGCELLKISKAKGYKEKEAELNAILKSRCGVQ